MRKIFMSLVLIFSTFIALSQNGGSETPQEAVAKKLVEAQLQAYNNRDLDAFLKPFSEYIEIYNYPDELKLMGKDKMLEAYKGFFEKTPNLHCEIVTRKVFGNTVIDHEKITGLSDDQKEPWEVLAIYKITDGEISEVRFIRK